MSKSGSWQRQVWIVGLLGLLGMCAAPLCAQLPTTRLDGIYPAGGASGSSFEMQIFGGDLDEARELLFSHAGITAKPKMGEPTPFDEGPQPIENTFAVTIAGDVPPGNYTVRCRGKYGLSGPRTLIVDRRPEVLEVEPNAEPTQATLIEKWPCTLNGQLNNTADIDWFQFEGQAGQRVMLEGYARRIDARTDLILGISDESGRILAESRKGPDGDPIIDLKLPANGKYWIRARDVLYGGGGEFSYRIRLGVAPLIEFIFPPAGLPGSTSNFTIYGRNLPGSQPAEWSRGGQPLEKLSVQIALPGDLVDQLKYSDRLEPFQASLDGLEYRVASPDGPSNPVLVTLASAPMVLEQANETPQTAQLLTPPCEVAGQFYPQRDVDWYRFEAAEGDKFWIELYSHRLGFPTDPALVIQRMEKTEQGEEKITQVAWIDEVAQRIGGHEFDERTRDPWYLFTAPAAGTYRVLVREGYSSLVSDPRLTYRLAIRPVQPDFRMAAFPVDSSGSLLLRKGGREAIRVLAFRQDGYDGEIRVSVSGLPGGVTAPEVVIGPGSQVTSVVLSAAADAPAGIGKLQIVGKGKVADREVTRVARFGQPLQAVPFAQPNNAGQASLAARLTDSLLVVVSDAEKARVAFRLDDPNVIETARGGVIKVKYSLDREDGSGGNITGFPIGLPPTVNVPQINIGGNKQGEFELRLTAATPPGTYSFHVAGMLQGMNYARNPEAAAQAKQRQERITKILTEAQQTAQKRQQEAQQAQTALTQATTELTQATTAKTTADQAVTTTTNALKVAEEALNTAKKRAAEKPDDAGLKQQQQQAQTAFDDATTKAKVAQTAAAEATTKLEAATTKQKAAQEAKMKADQESQTAQQFLQQAQQEKQRADQRAQQTQQAANPRAFNLIVPSTPITIKIAEFPVQLSGMPEKTSVKQGEKLEIPVQVQRLYGFDQPVNSQLVLPGGVNGLQIQNATIPGNQDRGNVVVTAQAAATPGEHAVILRSTMSFNGQALTLDKKLTLVVEKVEAAK